MDNNKILKDDDIIDVAGGFKVDKITSDRFTKGSDGKYICPKCNNGSLNPGAMITPVIQAYQCGNCKRVYWEDLNHNTWVYYEE